MQRLPYISSFTQLDNPLKPSHTLLPVELIYQILVEYAGYTVHMTCLNLIPTSNMFIPATVSRTFRELWLQCLSEAFEIPGPFDPQNKKETPYNYTL